MANSEKGEASVTVGGQTYRLKLSMNARCELETVLSTPKRTFRFGEVLEEMNRNNQTCIRAFLWAALQHYHRQQFPNPESVGPLVDEAGDTKVFMVAITAAVKRSAPDDADVEAVTAGRPTNARAAATKAMASTSEAISGLPVQQG